MNPYPTKYVEGRSGTFDNSVWALASLALESEQKLPPARSAQPPAQIYLVITGTSSTIGQSTGACGTIGQFRGTSGTVGQFMNAICTGVQEAQAPDFEEAVATFYSTLLEKQEPLGKEFEQVLYKNLWNLYVRS